MLKSCNLGMTLTFVWVRCLASCYKEGAFSGFNFIPELNFKPALFSLIRIVFCQRSPCMVKCILCVEMRSLLSVEIYPLPDFQSHSRFGYINFHFLEILYFATTTLAWSSAFNFSLKFVTLEFERVITKHVSF